MKDLNIKIRRGKPYTPQEGGRYERVHDTVKQKMRALAKEAEKQGKQVTVKDLLTSALYMYK